MTVKIAAQTLARADEAISALELNRPHAKSQAETFITIERQTAYLAYLDGKTARARALNKLCDRVARAIPGGQGRLP